MSFILTLFIISFTFLGMYIGNKKDLKYFSINSIFGLFLVNGIFYTFISSNYLSINYHKSTFIYLLLCVMLGFIVMKIICMKSDNPDDISITCFSFISCYLFLLTKMSLFSFFIGFIYYILIGIYIKNTKSYVNVFIGFIAAFLMSFVSSWMIGYVFSFLLGFIFYFLISIYNVVFKNCNKCSLIGLIVGIVIGFFGGIL